MHYILSLFFFLSLSAFTPQPITPCPVVGYKEISFFDEFHRIKRTLLVWYPVATSVEGQSSSNLWDVFKIAPGSPISNPKVKKPLIIISHGYGGSPHQLSWLIEKLVHNNYIVLGLQHLDKLNGKWQINHWQRAQDIQTLLDHFSSHPFAKSADLNRIGVAGFSISIPTYIVASNADQVLVTKNNADFFCKNIPHSICQTIPGEAGHYIFISEPIEKNKLSPNLSFLIKDNPNVDRKWIQYEVAENALNFFKQL